MFDQIRSRLGSLGSVLPALGDQLKAALDKGIPGAALAEQALGFAAGVLPPKVGEPLKAFLADEKKRNVAMTAGGLVALVAGQKLAALALFGKGLSGLEKVWREAHPEFDGGFAERWQKALDFYEQTHQEPTNRKLHIVGIPFIVAGSAGLLVFPAFSPFWGVSAASFAGGWVLNFIGHGFFEKGAPAFADDPLSFVAGPVWDFQQLLGLRKSAAPANGNGQSHAQA